MIIIKKFINKIFGNKGAGRIFDCMKHIKISLNRILRFLGLMSEPSKLENNISSEDLLIKRNNVFYGYYDKTPFSKDGKKILANVAGEKNEPPKKEEELKVGFFERNSKEFKNLGTTTTWCWQQGCRLQWFPGSENDKVIYNKMIQGEYSSVIQKIENKKVLKKYAFPIYDINPNGKNALTLNFSRLHRLRRGYGYVEIEDDTKDEKIPNEDGIWLGDLEANEKKLLMSIKKISEKGWSDSMNGAEHYVNFISYCEDGRKFAFLHVWEREGRPRRVRLIISDEDGEELLPIPTEMRVSHYSWIGNNKIVFTAKDQKGTMSYFIYNLKNSKIDIIGKSILNRDGHPCLFDNSSKLLTDTPPDKYGEQSLLVYDLEKNEMSEIFRGNNPRMFSGELRCDFHPRLDSSGKLVVIDFPQKKHRIMKLFDLQYMKKGMR